MPFPITHLHVAHRVSQALSLDDAQAAAFLLGALAPDGVHYRAGLEGASQSEIGAAKKASHLCPVSDERWGYVTDNDGWLAEIRRFLAAEKFDMISYQKNSPDGFLAAGYAAHALTDLYCNLTIWKNFRTNHPEEAAKGYASAYYREIPALDLELYQQSETAHILRLLPLAVPRDFPGRVRAEEITAIRASIFAEKHDRYTTYINQPPADTAGNRLVTSAMMREFVEGAAVFVREQLTPPAKPSSSRANT